MTLDILICTMADRLGRIAGMLLPPRSDVRYVVSCQYGYDAPPTCPRELADREDVRLVFLEGKGLSRNRNHCLKHAKGDILLIADDDEKFSNEGISELIRIYEQDPEVDVALLKIDGLDKYYPQVAFDFRMKDFRGAYYTTSHEMSMRRTSIQDLAFDERFGLGSEYLSCGEEQVFICDALRHRKVVRWFPVVIGSTAPGTTGERFLEDQGVQRAKGATFCYLFGRGMAWLMCLKESLHYLVYKKVNPIPLMCHMNDGIRYITH